ncbi:hypothetical protein WNY37_05145 [Henriciella sp. AS95]|uniref:hypothetical protein n=1 Tax=Henriciella sp. AS95 TaxID=3135782 RepID=UPI00316F6B06
MTNNPFKARTKAQKEAVQARKTRDSDSLGVSYDAFDLSLQHSRTTGYFNELSIHYKADYSIERYVQMRRANKGKLIEVGTSWSMDWLLANIDTLEQFDIDPQIMAGALDADPACISEVSLRLLERLIERRSLESRGQTHVQSRKLAIGDSLINYLASMMLDALDYNDELYIPRDLIVLIKHQMGADTSAEARAAEVHNNRFSAIWLAAKLRCQGKVGSIRQVAKIFETSPSTVARWFDNHQQFEREVQEALVAINSDWFKDLRDRVDKQNL